MDLFPTVEPSTVDARTSETVAIEDGFPFADISIIAEAESWRKEIYRPIYHVHKWWAQRLGSVFRSIILASVHSTDAPILDLFYSQNDLAGTVVYDPFMGSGTTIGEAVKLGCTAIGRDINPVAYNTVRAAFSRVTASGVRNTFRQLEATVGAQIRKLYELIDSSHVLYYFWVKQVDCPNCGVPVDLFNSYIFARHAYPTKHPEAQCICPECGDVFSSAYNSISETCPVCSCSFDPQAGPAMRAKARCGDCGGVFPIVTAAKAAGAPPRHRLYAKIVLRPDGQKEYRRITSEDIRAYENAGVLLKDEPPLIDPLPIEPGHNTNQAMNYCYTRWDQFFNERQLLALTWLGREIQKISDDDYRFVFAVLFSGTLEFNNMFCSFKGEGTGAVRHMFSHHILKPERQPLEANVWGTPKSSGAFSTLFKSRLLRALEYRKAPFEVQVEQKDTRAVGHKRYDCNNPIPSDIYFAKDAADIRRGCIYLSCGDSSETDIRDRSVDIIVTDPPFFDNVHYSELADFFYAWQRPLLHPGDNSVGTTRNTREVQDSSATRFSEKLASVFRECHRVLSDAGRLVFTYHHSREEGWLSLAHAISSAAFSCVYAHPVKAEMSVASPKQQAKEPIDLDIILVCRKRKRDDRPLLEEDDALEAAVSIYRRQAEKFWELGRRLSRNDLKVMLLAQVLVALSPGRDENDLIADFERVSASADGQIETLHGKQPSRTGTRVRSPIRN